MALLLSSVHGWRLLVLIMYMYNRICGHVHSHIMVIIVHIVVHSHTLRFHCCKLFWHISTFNRVEYIVDHTSCSSCEYFFVCVLLDHAGRMKMR